MPLKVLIAEDDEDQLSIRCLLLEQRGFEVFGAPDAPSALALAAAHAPDCAVVDLGLPDEAAGLSLIRGLKSLNSNIQILVLTGADPARFLLHPERELVRQVFLKGSCLPELVKALAALAANEPVTSQTPERSSTPQPS